MNFDFGWFLTVPGMLITGGVLLLIIALIILIATNKKKKDDMNDLDTGSDMSNESVMGQPTVDAGAGMATDFSNATAMPDMNSQPVNMEADSLMNMPTPISTEPVSDTSIGMDMNTGNSVVAPEMVTPEPVETITPEVVNSMDTPSM